MQLAFFTGLSGTVLTAAERTFLRAARPAGVILFARNVSHPSQLRRLVGDALSAIGGEALVLIDQEGGRVQRLRPPYWRALPPARAYAQSLGSNQWPPAAAARAIARLTAADLRAVGITCNCAPVLDLPVPGAHAIIGDRAYADAVATVIEVGRAVAAGYAAGGVVAVIKHMPGHGRATADSHLALPIVTTSRAELEVSDFAPFKALAGAAAAMTAHVVYTAIDPDRPASTSAKVHAEVMRGHIGFDGLLMSDDISMQALAGPMRARAAAVIAAGSDIALHCNGVLAEMAEVAAAVPQLAGPARARFERAALVTRQQAAFDHAAAEACLAAVLALSA